MTSFDKISDYVNAGDFTALFISELGWDNPTGSRPVRYSDDESGEVFTATPVATKRGVVVYHCPRLLDRLTLEPLDREIAKRSVERLLILTEGPQQQWRWPEPRKSGGTRYVTHQHTVGSPNPALVQRLLAVRFTLDEEDRLNVLVVRERVRAQFNADEVTSKFYNEFRDNQKTLMDAIEGIRDEQDRSWYSSLLLNRLMFIYFMQRKGFLNDDQNYLRSSLAAVRDVVGDNMFYEFYRSFLLPLFHDGLGSDEHSYQDERFAQIIGDVPYINGGIFAVHSLEDEYEISVPDKTFEAIFNFFDRYRWHLDERPTGNPEEINPEILGYIFEKYVNLKEAGDEKGAYYTKEDVTGYMSAAALLPVVIDRLTDVLGTSPWHLPQEQPDRYLPEGLTYATSADLPPDVAAANPAEYGLLDEFADSDLGLPGERWRETIERRFTANALRLELANGTIADTHAAVTANLDLQDLLLDWIAELADTEAIAQVWNVLIDLKIVDPTCGSGAFLFAALDVLEELYDATLTAAEKQVANQTASHEVAAIVEEAGSHVSRDYFVMKRAVLANLYGVDLMPEASEIARLRLFLTLVARIHDRSEVEPLPDLDMNIRSGNLLVGCSTVEDAQNRFGGDLLAMERLNEIAAQASDTGSVYRDFVEAQRDGEPAAVVVALKKKLNERTSTLRSELDLLYSPYDDESFDHEEWRESHQPFHWFVEFPEVMGDGGFDAVIGNPPYVQKSDVKSYAYSGFKTDKSPNIYAPCMERAASLVGDKGGYALIVPISVQFSDRGFDIARKAVLDVLSPCWVSAYSRNPSALFDAGVGVRSSIVVARRRAGQPTVFTTGLRRWWGAARPYLFDTNTYTSIGLKDTKERWPRLRNEAEAELYRSLTGNGRSLALSCARSGPAIGFKQIALYYMSLYVDEPPSWDAKGKRIPQTSVGSLSFRDERTRDIAWILLSGRLGVWWWGSLGDDFHVTSTVLKDFPVDVSDVDAIGDQLVDLARELRVEQQRHPLVTLYNKKEMGNYDMSRCRHITDQADRAVLEHLELGHLWPTVLHADAALAKVTGERPGTRREWPYPI